MKKFVVALLIVINYRIQQKKILSFEANVASLECAHICLSIFLLLFQIIYMICKRNDEKLGQI